MLSGLGFREATLIMQITTVAYANYYGQFLISRIITKWHKHSFLRAGMELSMYRVPPGGDKFFDSAEGKLVRIERSADVRFCLRLKEPDRNPKVIIGRTWQRLQHPATKEPSYAFRSQYSQLSPEHPRLRRQGIARCSTCSCVPTATVQLADFWSSCRSM
mgnify:CR=1 FL=1